MIIPNPIQHPVRIEYQPTYETHCTIGVQPFRGTIYIDFVPDNYLLEFEAFEKWLKEITVGKDHIIEGLCERIFDELMANLAPNTLAVTVNAETTVHAPVSAFMSTEIGEL